MGPVMGRCGRGRCSLPGGSASSQASAALGLAQAVWSRSSVGWSSSPAAPAPSASGGSQAVAPVSPLYQYSLPSSAVARAHAEEGAAAAWLRLSSRARAGGVSHRVSPVFMFQKYEPPSSSGTAVQSPHSSAAAAMGAANPLLRWLSLRKCAPGAPSNSVRSVRSLE